MVLTRTMTTLNFPTGLLRTERRATRRLPLRCRIRPDDLSRRVTAGTPLGSPFKTTASLTVAPELDDLTVTGSAGFFTDPLDDNGNMIGNDVEHLTSEQAGEGNDARVDVRISPTTTAIVNINLEETVGPHQQAINFSLSNGGSPFQIKKTALDEAEIVVAPGTTLTAAAPYSFTLTVNEFDNAPQNSSDIEIRVTVVVDNVAPTFTNAPATGTVVERAKDAPIADFDASDPNNQVLTYRISGKDDNARDILGGLDWDEDTGVLKTKDVVESPIDPAGLRRSRHGRRPATLDVDETVAPDNEHVFVITVTDGTLSASHEFTLTVTDEPDPAPGSDQKLTVMEDNAGGADASFGFAPALGGAGDYSIDQQIDNNGNIIPDSDDVLFGVDPQTGAIYLKTAGSVDFESGIVTYTLSVKRSVAGGTSQSGIVVVSVTDVNEAPEFSAVDNARTMPIALYVLESAAIGTVVSIGQDAGNSPTPYPQCSRPPTRTALRRATR